MIYCWLYTPFAVNWLYSFFIIETLLNNTRLSGIGTFEFAGCNEITLSEELAGYCVMFTATHGNDDLIPEVDEDEE